MRIILLTSYIIIYIVICDPFDGHDAMTEGIPNPTFSAATGSCPHRTTSPAAAITSRQEHRRNCAGEALLVLSPRYLSSTFNNH